MREAHVPAQQPEAQEDPRLPWPYADARRPGRHQGPPSAGPRPPLGLIWRIRDRATFAALARARAQRLGPVTLRYVSGPAADPARVAVATTRAAGNAVARNRVRRRLRAAVATHEPELNPGGAYLFGAGREAIEIPFDTLTATVGALVRSVKAAA
jgi:ribonuclease P protein component